MHQCQAVCYKRHMTEEQMEKLRNELVELHKKRDNMVAELGEFAQENNDLRENSAYIRMEQKIQLVNSQIKRILDEFNEYYRKQKVIKHSQKMKRFAGK